LAAAGGECGEGGEKERRGGEKKATKKVTVTFGYRRRSRRWGVRRGRRGKREEGKGGEKR